MSDTLAKGTLAGESVTSNGPSMNLCIRLSIAALVPEQPRAYTRCRCNVLVYGIIHR